MKDVLIVRIDKVGEKLDLETKEKVYEQYSN